MAKPFLGQVEGNARCHGLDAKAVPKPFGRGMQTGDTGGFHDFAHPPPGGCPRPIPQMHLAASVRASAGRSDGVHEVEGIEEARRDRNRPENASAAFLEALYDEDAIVDVHAVSREGEGFGDPASGVGEGAAKRPDFAGSGLGSEQEGLPLGRGKILALATAIIQAHAGSPSQDAGGTALHVAAGEPQAGRGRAGWCAKPGPAETELGIVFQRLPKPCFWATSEHSEPEQRRRRTRPSVEPVLVYPVVLAPCCLRLKHYS